MNHIIYNPNDLYMGINFEEIKADLKTLYKDMKDFNSIVIINTEDGFNISVNSLGKVELFFDNIHGWSSHVTKIEKAFKKQIHCFNLSA